MGWFVRPHLGLVNRWLIIGFTALEIIICTKEMAGSNCKTTENTLSGTQQQSDLCVSLSQGTWPFLCEHEVLNQWILGYSHKFQPTKLLILLFNLSQLVISNNHTKYPSVIYTGWWFGTYFIFPYIGNNNPNWLSYFSKGLKPPTSIYYIC